VRECASCHRSFQDKLSHCPYDGSPLVRSSEPHQDDHLGRTLDDKYRIEARLGMGGMCDIYHATNLSTGTPCAVKVLHSDLASDEASIRQFKHEVYTASLIEHPNVVALLDSGETGEGVFYMVMELIEGTTLKQVIQRDGPFELPRLSNIVKQIGDALDVAHTQGIIHRDLKPDNIMLLKGAGKELETVKVLDFGIAKVNTGDLSGSGEKAPSHIVMGTPRYMSPEQCQGHTLDARSDIYSLGLIVYEMIAGQPPFTDTSARVLMNRHTQEQVPDLKQWRPDLQIAVERAVLHALEKSPLKRPQSARAFAEEINLALHSDPSIPSFSPDQHSSSSELKSNLVPFVKKVQGSVSIVEYVSKEEELERQKIKKLLSTSGQIKTHFKKRWAHWLIGFIILLLIVIVILLVLLLTTDPHQNS
jgi:eukaryotic-like serine/threonine-protein kinase